MTKWIETSLRPQGKPWPGLNTADGKLDPGVGFLEDGSVNAIINEGDLLEKRNGFIRGIEERFTGVVCGLFRYTDDCGIEYLVVADQSGIKVRNPFSIPVFLGSDTFPIDNFVDLSASRWVNTGGYDINNQSLVLNSGATFSTSEFVESSRLMRWFKDASLGSYQVEIEYATSAGLGLQVASVVIKKAASSWLQANIVMNGSTYKVSAQIVISGVRSTLAEANLEDPLVGDGFMKLSYDAVSRTVSVRTVTVGGPVSEISATINEVQAAALGQGSAIGLSYADVFPVAIGSVTGGAI